MMILMIGKMDRTGHALMQFNVISIKLVSKKMTMVLMINMITKMIMWMITTPFSAKDASLSPLAVHVDKNKSEEKHNFETSNSTKQYMEKHIFELSTSLAQNNIVR